MKKQKHIGKSCEHMTEQRSDQLKKYGERAAVLARSRGKDQSSWEDYCPLMGDNNKAAWKIGWIIKWEDMT